MEKERERERKEGGREGGREGDEFLPELSQTVEETGPRLLQWDDVMEWPV